ncbi:MAG: phosphoenolpyruvate synthase, partial [Bacteroidia bacterium]|nr:phosphoenolpyruvate synthase [Bacteroidia bacterium]
MKTNFILPISQLSNKDVAVAGGKNASLGEMIKSLKSTGILVPDGFATTSEAYLYFLFENRLEKKIRTQLEQLDTKNFTNLNEISKNIRQLFLDAAMPDTLRDEIRTHYAALSEPYGNQISVAVRSSATAEDLPAASFAGLHDSFLNVQGDGQITEAIKKCFASLFNARAIKYRHDYGFDHMKVALSAGIQLMVRSDLASSGICFTLEPESGFRDVVTISGCWGLGENIVQGNVNPDEFCVFKPMLQAGKQAILYKKLGTKAKTLVYSTPNDTLLNTTTVNTDTLPEKQRQWVLDENEIMQLAKWCMAIEEHYHCPMDIEWAKDGNDNRIYIIQARPETVHSLKDPYVKTEYQLKETGNILAKGNAVGSGIACGKARLIQSPAEAEKLQPGEVLVTDITNPDWDPILKKASAIITNKGGRTSHAAIIAREIGAVAIVGAGNATETIRDGDLITVSCAQGKTGFVYNGLLKWETKKINFHNIPMPETAPMLILGDPDKAFKYSFYPNRGIGLMRLEFIINNAIRIHPMALVKYNELTDEKAKEEIDALTGDDPTRESYFIDKLAQAVATIGAAFYPKDVIVRMSDFKTNEYASLIGGKQFEPAEENPMIGFR